jgi:RNA polymerase sigma-70 factor (ECF subfamily)
VATHPELPATRLLVEQAQAGDQDAFAQLYRRFVPRVRGLVAVRMGRVLADFVDAEDLVQETLAAAFTRLKSFRTDQADASFACWLARLVERRIQDHWRARGARKRGGGKVARMADLRTTARERAVASAADPSPSRALQQRELAREVEGALLTLGERYRIAVYCRLVLDMEFAAIAEEMGLKNAATACALFHKATARLAARLGRSWP